jgi:hypothetical protein
MFAAIIGDKTRLWQLRENLRSELAICGTITALDFLIG